MFARRGNDVQPAEHVPLVPLSLAFHDEQGARPRQDGSTDRRQRGGRESEPVFPDSHNKLPELDFKPLALRFWFLCLVLTWNLIVTGILVILFLIEKFAMTNIWTYFVVQILPTVVGTVTATLLDAMVLNLARITPFILCAAGDSTTSADQQGCIAGDSILLWYFPNFSYTDALASRNGLLLFSNVLDFLALFILGFKASLLSTFKLEYIWVNEWAALFLLVYYIMVNIHTLWVMSYMWNRTTGLRWNPISMADHLTLFRNASFLGEFAGTSIASHSATRARLRTLRLRLGYWRTGSKLWHGFDECPSRHYFSQAGTENEAPLELSMKQITRRRYATTGLFIQPFWRIFFATGAALLVAGHVTALAFSQDNKGKFETDLSYSVVAVVCQFSPVILISLFTWFWEDNGHYMAHTQPLVALHDAATADESLLLDYTCLPRPVTIFTALGKGHYKLAITSAVAIIQRLLPIIAGASVMISHPKSKEGNEDKVRTVRISVASFYVIIVWLFIYVVLICWDVGTEGYKRYLPHYYGSIADLLSWTYASGLLRDDNLCIDTEGTLAGNPLDVKITDATEAATEANNSRRANLRDQGEEWYMKARLRLAGKRYHFGLVPVHGKADMHTIGIGVVDDTLQVNPVPVPRRLRALDFLRRRKGAAGDGTESGTYKIEGAGWASGRKS